MKKSFLMLGVAAMALASCTQNEVVEYAENRAIQFDAFVGKSTRADVKELDTDGLTQFNVFAYHTGNVVDYNNVAVTGGGSSWTAEANAYWQANNDYEFAAYSDQNTALSSGVSFADKTLTFTGYTVGEKDLVAAQTSVKSQTDVNSYSAVSLTFYHMLSQIKFTFKNSDAADYKLAISNIKITAGKTANGTFTMTAPNIPSITWDATDSNNGEYTIADIADIAKGPSGSTASESLLILPQSTTGLKVTFTARLTDANGTAIATGNFEAPLTISEDGGDAWEPGYRYNYIAELNGSDVPVNPVDPSQPGDGSNPKPKVIEFSNITVNPWADSNAAGSTTPSVVNPEP